MIKTIKEPTKHSPIGASSMYRWAACPGSVKLSGMAAERGSSPHAQLGTTAHEVAEFYLSNGFWPLPDDFGLTMSELDSMVKDGCSIYTDYIARMRLEDPDVIIHIEHTFDMNMVYPGCYGTADAVAYFPSSKILRVIDYKHGKGVVVEVEDNLQGQYYALGAIETLKYPFNQIQIVIVQPRAFHAKGPIRTWTYGIEKLLDFRADLIEAAKRTEEPNAYFEAGDHCFFCGAIDICPKSSEAKKAKRSKIMKPLFQKDPADEFEPVAGFK